ncbi:putative disease resistance protein, partial [Quercus suber]
HLTCLRSLSLKSSSFEKLPNEVEKLKHLRLLNLSYNHKITELPEMLCNLCNLQTLDISDCYIRKLPQGMGKLIKLRHLITSYLSDFDRSLLPSFLTEPFPKGIGRLSSLRTLERFVIGGECKLGELKNLVHLKGSLGIKGLENVTDFDYSSPTEAEVILHIEECEGELQTMCHLGKHILHKREWSCKRFWHHDWNISRGQLHLRSCLLNSGAEHMGLGKNFCDINMRPQKKVLAVYILYTRLIKPMFEVLRIENDDYRMLKINGELGTMMCLDKTSDARETGNHRGNLYVLFLPPLLAEAK